MGRPYATELKRIPHTVEWALEQDVAELANTLGDFAGLDLIAVGSGGSFAAASYAALLHEAYAGRMARASTPLEAISRSATRDTAALLLSAGGTNVDIRQAAMAVLAGGYDAVSALTTKPGSPLGRLLTRVGAAAHEFTVPGGRDGFLATNSLIATLVLLNRAFTLCSGLPEQRIAVELSSDLFKGPMAILQKRTLLVLAQGWASPAALDFESRFSEAALANVTVTDPRNFAHGRHYWLTRHASETGIVSFETRDSTRASSRMLSILPKDLDVLRIESKEEGPLATLELVRASMQLAGIAAEPQNVDPGRPFVPEFGRRLYRAGPASRVRASNDPWIARKLKASFLGPRSNAAEINAAFQRFREHLEATHFRGIVLDYDGTLCARERRFDRLEPAMSVELNRLLSSGALLGVASGRGRSVFQELRQAIDQAYWSQVTVGMYNGAWVLRLSDELVEPEFQDSPWLAEASHRMKRVEKAFGFEIESRPSQVSLLPHRGLRPTDLRVVAMEHLVGISGISVLASSHSVDIVASTTSKNSVVHAMLSQMATETEQAVLRIGDQGALGGNDFDLLGTGLSLSVDNVSSSLETCWNLGAAGQTGPSLTLEYLRAVRADYGVLRFDTSKASSRGSSPR